MSRCADCEFWVSAAALTAPSPTADSLRASGFSAVPQGKWSDSITLGPATIIKFDIASGALVQLDGEGLGWASASNPIGRFVYRSHSFEDWATYQSTCVLPTLFVRIGSVIPERKCGSGIESTHRPCTPLRPRPSGRYGYKHGGKHPHPIPDSLTLTGCVFRC